MRLLRAFALALDLEEEFFLGFYRKPLTQINMLHYPPHPPLTPGRQTRDQAAFGYDLLHHPRPGRCRRAPNPASRRGLDRGTAGPRHLRHQYRRHDGALDQ